MKGDSMVCCNIRQAGGVVARVAAAVSLSAAALPASASFLSGEALDTAATVGSAATTTPR